MLLRNLLDKTDIVSISADMDMEIHCISYDTRTLCSGALYIAVRGYETDGHEFIEEAAEKGAICVVCESAPAIDIKHIIVKDTRIALAEISAAWFGYPADSLIVLGVTGTNGKTTVSTLSKRVIEECSGMKTGLIGTNRNMIGDRELQAERTTPGAYEIQELLSMMVAEGCRYAVIEVSSHALSQGRVHGIMFDVAVYTNLSQDHLDFHASMEEYAMTKAILFKNCKKAAVNLDDEYSAIMTSDAACELLTFAIKNGKADLVAKNIKLHSEKVDFSLLTIGSLKRVELGIPGLFSVYNALATISASVLLGFDHATIISVLETCKGVKGRAEVVPVDRDFTVLIDYAHTPDALKNILSAARAITRGRVVTLFGCGGDRDRLKRPLMGVVAVELSDFVIVTSDNPRTEVPGEIIEEILVGLENTKTPHMVIENRREAIHWALDNAQKDDVLILAGKGHETYQIFGKNKVHFDEREVVAEYFETHKVIDDEERA